MPGNLVHRVMETFTLAIWCCGKDALRQLRTEERGSHLVEVALGIGFVLLLGAILWPQLQQLLTTLISKWKVP
ncbi:hypothetical protein [Kutzneria buriramensis]|uniref:Uncharacterized protein n=1 Tax=Kutzneria buriramensis TaxID=1045776 RepID=A0A3E0GVJ7_9PSEU|nr:hypothetical protein [Kutzneria buriramensis]REH28639.1 hypothetical protein BCF44_12681 [Kutzneria buriramensis]